MTKKFTLEPVDGRKSFYNKMFVEYDYSNGIYTCYSYNTAVASYNAATHEFKRLWWSWSATTARHIDAFREFCGLNRICKKEWEKLSVMN